MDTAQDARRDEMVDGSGRIRPIWRRPFATVQSLGAAALAERSRLLARAAVEDGVATILSDTSAPSWRCDAMPLVLGAAEFATLADGLAERASLIETVLDDVYGAQALLADGTLPPVVVHGSRSFLRNCRREAADAPRRRLQLYAADLLRDADGTFRVTADRCARPGGIGRLLDNRRLLRRVMPELFGPDVEALERFFEFWRETIGRSGPSDRDAVDGAAAVLSEGYRDPDWFEHVLLARELGCDLVQGGDLTIRGGRLYVKSLRGLKRIDVLLPRQDARLLDPLELDWTASSGVPGLLALQRAGRVTVANDPAAAFGEVPGLFAHLPAIARRRLGRDLALGARETLWLAAPGAWDRVAGSPEDWLIRSAFDADVPSVRPAFLAARGRAALADAAARRPDALVAQRRLLASVAPCVDDEGRLEARPVAFRVFLLRGADGWVPLPSGFVRVLGTDADRSGRDGPDPDGPDPDGPDPGGADALPSGGFAKDLLVVADDEPVGDADGRTPSTGWPAVREGTTRRVRPVVRRVEGDLPARVAEEFFGLGRALEQLETRARLVRALAIRMQRFVQRPRELVELRILSACLLRSELLPAELLIDPSAHGLAPALALLARGGSGGALEGGVQGIGRRLDRLRDRLTGEMHVTLARGLGGIAALFADGRRGGGLDALGSVTGAILGFTATLAGLSAESMVRGGGRLFLELGLRLTRAETVCVETEAAFGPAASLPGRGEDPDLDTALRLLLELRDSLLTYRARYLGRLDPGLVLDLLVADRSNPRALCFQLAQTLELARATGEAGSVEIENTVSRLIAEADAIVALLLDAADPEAASRALPGRFAAIEAEINGIRRAIARRHLDLLPPFRSVGS